MSCQRHSSVEEFYFHGGGLPMIPIGSASVLGENLSLFDKNINNKFIIFHSNEYF